MSGGKCKVGYGEGQNGYGTEALAQTVFLRELFLKILQDSQENVCVGVIF